jgi:hypothetical protein
MGAMKRSIDIIISKSGQIRFIYNDDLLSLAGLGTATIQRASHVEPSEDGSGWKADMSPVNGPMLGPYTTRAEALEHEVDWLLQHNIPQPTKVA